MLNSILFYSLGLGLHNLSFTKRKLVILEDTQERVIVFTLYQKLL